MFKETLLYNKYILYIPFVSKLVFFDSLLKKGDLSMKYITLLGIVATLASGYSLESLSFIEEFKVAEIAFDVFAEQQGASLVFKKTSNNRMYPTPDVLDSDFLFAPFIVFTCINGHWYAEQANDIEQLKRILDFNEKVSCKIAIIGADKIKDSTTKINAKYGHYSNTLLVELGI